MSKRLLQAARAWLILLTAGVIGIWLTVARATIVVQGPADFQAAVEECLEKILNSGGQAAANLNQLINSGNVHTIKPESGFGSNTPNDFGDAANGTGTGSTTGWDKGWDKPFNGDTTKNDPCANLAHELTHAADADKGIRDPSPGQNEIKKNEIKACGVENEYRANNGLDKRNKYGGKDLP